MQTLYKTFELILFAIEVELEGITDVYLNPADYLLENVKHYGYVLASSLSEVDKMKDFQFPEHIERGLK